MAVETTTSFSNNLHSYYQKLLLKSAESRLRLKQFADSKVHPRGTGKDYQILRYGNIPANVTPLTEGVTPTETTADTDKQVISIDEYGDFMIVSELLSKTAIDPVMQNLAKRFGYHAAKTMDTVIINELVANATNIQYTGAATSEGTVTATDLFTAQSALLGVRPLRSQDARELQDGFYAWVVHPDISVDMFSDTSAGGVIELNKYVAGLANKPLNGEVGKVYGARVVDSSNLPKVDNGTTDVYRSFMIADEAYYTTSFDKDAIKIINKDVGSAGTADPLNQRGTIGYKMQFGTKYIGGDFTNANGASPDTVIQVRGAATPS